MRIWSTERPYKRIDEEACETFATEWVKYVDGLRRSDYPPSEEICKKKFADSAHYSDCVIEKIIELFFPTFEFESHISRYTPQVLIKALQLDNFSKERRQVIEQNITREFLKRAIEFYTRDNFINLNQIFSEESADSTEKLKEILTMMQEYLQD